MNALNLAEECHIVNGIAPVDLDAAATNSDVVNISNFNRAYAILQLGVTGAASTITVTACDDVTPSNETAIAFSYYAETAAAGDTLGARTDATSAGFATSTNDGVFYVIEVTAAAVNAVSERKYFRVKCSDPGAPTLGSCVIVLVGPRYAGDPASASHTTAIV